MDGYWGKVSGGDFCEYNYARTYYVGELVSFSTACLNFPMVWSAYAYAKAYLYPTESLPKLLWLVIFLRTINLACAGSQHMTLRGNIADAQEATLAMTCFCYAFAFYCWGKNNEINRWVACSWGIISGCIELFSLTHINDPVPAGPIVNAVFVIYITFWSTSISNRFLATASWLFIFAEVFFFITDIRNGYCSTLHGYQLHSIGHVAGAISEWFDAMWLVALHFESQGKPIKVAWTRIGLPVIEHNYKNLNP